MIPPIAREARPRRSRRVRGIRAIREFSVFQWPAMVYFHLAAVVWAFATLAFDLGCPYALEKSPLRRGGIESPPRGFCSTLSFEPALRPRIRGKITPSSAVRDSTECRGLLGSVSNGLSPCHSAVFRFTFLRRPAAILLLAVTGVAQQKNPTFAGRA